MKIKYDAISNAGCVRSNNEDMALVFGAFLRDDAQRSMVPMTRRPRFTALVADGMGGYGGGEVASEMTLQSFDDFLTSLPEGLEADEVAARVKQWFRTNNAAVIARGASEPGLQNMGTTLSGIFTYGPLEFMVNAGDSRVYRRRYDTLRRLSADHSERERCNDPSLPSNLIYNAIGIPEAFVDVTCLTTDFPMVDGDTYVICSDGLCDMIDDEAIDRILGEGGDARRLLDAALEAGGKDNCTIVVLQVSIPEDYEPAAETATDEPSESALPERAEAAASEEPEARPAAAAAMPPVEVPVEAAIGFSIDEPDTADDDTGATPPPYIPEEMRIADMADARPAPHEAVPETSHAAASAPESRTKTAGRLFKEAFKTLLGK